MSVCGRSQTTPRPTVRGPRHAAAPNRYSSSFSSIPCRVGGWSEKLRGFAPRSLLWLSSPLWLCVDGNHSGVTDGVLWYSQLGDHENRYEFEGGSWSRGFSTCALRIRFDVRAPSFLAPSFATPPVGSPLLLSLRLRPWLCLCTLCCVLLG